MWKYYVYLHKTTDGDVFYVGKGTSAGRYPFARAYTKRNRNKGWWDKVRASGLVVDIVIFCLSDPEAQEQEKRLIAEYGRADLGHGCLVNLTDGGDGHAGHIKPPETLAKLSAHASKPRSAAWVASMRRSRKITGNNGVVKRGDKLPDAWRKNIGAGNSGLRNAWFGKPSPVSKKVKDTATGAIFDSVARAAEATGVNAKTLYQYLDGTRVNRTTLVRL